MTVPAINGADIRVIADQYQRVTVKPSRKIVDTLLAAADRIDALEAGVSRLLTEMAKRD